MKNKNLFSKLCSPVVDAQSSDAGYDSRATVGSPSAFHRSVVLKLCTVLAILLFVGVGNAWGGQYVYNFSSNSYWYTASTGNDHPATNTNLTSFYDNRNPRVQWTLSSSNDRSRFNSGYFILGKTGKYINLPTYSGEKITSVVVHSSSSCGTSVTVDIYTSSGSSATTTQTANQTWSTQDHDYTYNIATASQGAALRIQVTNNNRVQFTSVTINTESAGTSVTLSKAATTNGSFLWAHHFCMLKHRNTMS